MQPSSFLTSDETVNITLKYKIQPWPAFETCITLWKTKALWSCASKEFHWCKIMDSQWIHLHSSSQLPMVKYRGGGKTIIILSDSCSLSCPPTPPLPLSSTQFFFCSSSYFPLLFYSILVHFCHLHFTVQRAPPPPAS